MERLTTNASFEGRLKIVARVTNAAAEEPGSFLYFHNIARAAVYWWLCDESDEARLSDKVVVVCDIAEPAEPAEEPEVGAGEETSVTFPITIRPLAPGLGLTDLVTEARSVVARKVAEGAEDFEGLRDFRVEIDVAQVDEQRSEAA